MYDYRLDLKTMYSPVPAVAGPVAPKTGCFVRFRILAEANVASAGTLESLINISVFTPLPFRIRNWKNNYVHIDILYTSMNTITLYIKI